MKKFYLLLLSVFLAQLLAAQVDCDDISGNITPENATICQGESVLLTATGGSSYEWRLDNVVIDGQTGNTLNATQSGTYSVIIKEGDCSVPASNTSSVTVNPTPSGTISPANASICPGGETELTASGGDSYTWFRDGTEINGENNATLQVGEPGTYTVIIHLDDCSAPASNNAVVTESGGPTGTISPASGSICPGGEITLTATGGTSYTWFRNGDEINGQDNATLEVDETGTYSVIIHQGQCSGPASNTVTISAASAPTGSISPANASICAGGSTILTATGGTSYRWFRNGNQINGQTGATLTVTQAGTYTAEIQQGGCEGPASNSAVVTIAPAPTGTISPANAAICAGGSVELTATGGTSYAWFRNGNEINGQTGSTLTVTQSGTYSVIINQGDCEGPASNNAVVSVASAPNGTISPAIAAICPGGSQILTATGGTTYTWFLNGNEIAGETGSTLTVTQAGTYTATIIQGNCSGPASNSAVVSSSPIPTGTISPASGSVCPGGSITLTASGGTSYSWFLNGDEIEGETDATLSATSAGTYFVIIRQGTCSGPALNTSVITLASAPTGTISPATGTICQGGSVVLTATGGTTYTWFRNGTQINGQTGATLNVTLAGTYTATIRQGNCNGPAANSSVITVANAPTGTISPATAAICEGGSVPLTATGGSSYIWSLNGNVIAGQTSDVLNATQPGTYTVIIQQGNCSGPATNSAVVTSAAAPTGTISPASAAICGGGSQVLTATGGTSYTWMRDGVIIAGQEAETITVTQAGTYSVIINSGTCSGAAANTATVTTEDNGGTRYPDVSARPDVPVQLTARELGGTYEWTPATDLNNPSIFNPTVTTRTDREYIVKITTANGCVVTDTVLVKVKSIIFIPTGFTPDGNGVNDILMPRGEFTSIESFKVFNRWGQLMFETKQMGVGWDGKFKGVQQPSDTYTWLMLATGKDGQQVKLSGKTLLIR